MLSASERQDPGLGAWTFPVRRNPERIVSFSPGLRAASYPGCATPKCANPERVASFVRSAMLTQAGMVGRDWARMDRQGDASTPTGLGGSFGPLTQGSSRFATLGSAFQSFQDCSFPKHLNVQTTGPLATQGQAATEMPARPRPQTLDTRLPPPNNRDLPDPAPPDTRHPTP
jgi:hypothetical protein